MDLGNLSGVNHNFRAIYEATHYDPEPFPENPNEPHKKLFPVELYCYLSPKILPFDKGLNFRTWSYHSRFFMIDGIREALNTTHQVFHQWQTKLLNQDLPKMRAYLGEVSNLKANDKFDEKPYWQVREDVQNFHLSTHHFLHSIHHDPNVRMRQIFDRHFCIKCFDHIEPLEQMYSIIALQGEIGETLPIKALIDASFGKEVEDASLHKFLKNLSDKKVSFKLFHSALAAIVKYAQRSKVTLDDIERKNFPSLEKLEEALYTLDSSILSSKHIDHLEWRNTLKPCSEIISIRYNDDHGQQTAIRYRFILGNQLGKKQNKFDHSVYFEIKECFVATRVFSKDTLDELKYDPLIKFHEEIEEKNNDIETNKVLWISINEAMAGIRESKSETCYGMNLSQIEFIDNQGRFALIEKLHENYAEFVKIVPKWIRWALKEVENAPISLEPLRDPQSFMFNKDTELKAVKLIKRSDSFSFNAWEQFIYEASKGDQNTFKKIMLESEMTSLAEAAFIREAVLTSFDKSKFDLLQQCKASSFNDKDILKVATGLQEDMVKLQESCFRQLEPKYGSALSKEMIKELLLEGYEKSGGISMLWPSLQDNVISACIKSHSHH